MARKKLPHGMTPNMVKIMEAQKLAREQGLGSYGRFVAKGDTSAVDTKPAPGGRVCKRCGADISYRHGTAKYCDKCSVIVPLERRQERYREEHPVKMVNCTDCGVLMQAENGNQKLCPACAAKRRKARLREYHRIRRERLKVVGSDG